MVYQYSEYKQRTKDHNPHRRIQQWMGRQLRTGNSFRVLVRGGNDSFNKRKRTEDDPICNSTPCQKMQRLDNQNIFRQHDRLTIYNQIRGNDFNGVTGSCNPDTRLMQPLQYKGNISTYSRSSKHSGRQVEQTEETVIRINNAKEDVQLHTKEMGKLKVDAFPARHNHQLLTYWTLSAHPTASAIDALRQTWLPKGMYLYSPWKLTPQVLKHLKEQKIKREVLVAPLWPSQFWFPLILRMKHIQPPIVWKISQKGL